MDSLGKAGVRTQLGWAAAAPGLSGGCVSAGTAGSRGLDCGGAAAGTQWPRSLLAMSKRPQRPTWTSPWGCLSTFRTCTWSPRGKTLKARGAPQCLFRRSQKLHTVTSMISYSLGARSPSPDHFQWEGQEAYQRTWGLFEETPQMCSLKDMLVKYLSGKTKKAVENISLK